MKIKYTRNAKSEEALRKLQEEGRKLGSFYEGDREMKHEHHSERHPHFQHEHDAAEEMRHKEPEHHMGGHEHHSHDPYYSHHQKNK